MKHDKVFQQLSTLPFFDITTVGQLIRCSQKALYENIYRWIQKGIFIQLKKGLYTTTKYYESVIDKTDYIEFIANNLRTPSYLSLEYVLQKYSILTESVFAYTSVTLKLKREYKNKLGVFTYRQINKSLFTGFKVKNGSIYKIYEATKAKALFDYLYFKAKNNVMTEDFIRGLRLNLLDFTKQDIKEFKTYCSLTNNKKFSFLPKLLFKEYAN